MENETYGPAIDIWSVGCILAELLGRKPLWPGSDSQLLSVVAESALYHWSVSGSLLKRAPCRVPSAFALAVHQQEGGTQLVAVGGSQPKAAPRADAPGVSRSAMWRGCIATPVASLSVSMVAGPAETMVG